VIEIARDAAEGLVVATPWFADRNDPKVKAFVARYEKAYGKKPDQFAAQAYDAFHIIANALKTAGKADRDRLRDAMAATRNFTGVLGKFSFDAERDVVMEPSVLIVRGGKFQLFQ
jgi:branched-chain amino acid transport system substrate-binding protein